MFGRELAVADIGRSLQQRLRPELDARHDAVAARIANRRVLEAIAEQIEPRPDRRQRRQPVARGELQRVALVVERALQRGAQDVVGIVADLRLTALHGEQESRRERQFGAECDRVLDVARAHVDLEVRPLPRVEVGGLAEHHQACQVAFGARDDLRIDRALARVIGEVDEIGGGGQLEQRPAGDRHERLDLRRDGEGEVRHLLTGGVEHVAVGAELLQEECRLDVEGAAMQPHILAHFVDARRPHRLGVGGGCGETDDRGNREGSLMAWRVEPCHFTALL